MNYSWSDLKCYSKHQAFNFNDLELLLNSIDQEIVINYQSVYESLIFDHPLGNDTLLNGVTIDNGIEIKNINSGTSSRSDAELVINTIQNKITNEVHGRDVILPLSGGLDSRFVLMCVLNSNPSSLYTFTFGNCLDIEVRYAKAVANKNDIPWEYITFGSSDYLTHGKKLAINSLGMLSPAHAHLSICLEKIIHKFHNKPLLIHGFYGDPPAGDGCIPKLNNEVDTLLKKYIGHRDVSFVPKDIMNKIKSKLSMNYENYLKYNEKGFYNEYFKGTVRQNSLISFIPLTLLDKVDILTPYYDQDYINTFYSLEYNYRENRYLYCQIINDVMPNNTKKLKSTNNPHIVGLPIYKGFINPHRICVIIQTFLQIITNNHLVFANPFDSQHLGLLLSTGLKNEVVESKKFIEHILGIEIPIKLNKYFSFRNDSTLLFKILTLHYLFSEIIKYRSK